MGRIIAIDWDRREARCVVASSIGGRRRVLAAKSVPMVDWTQGGQSRADVAESLRAVLDQANAGRGTVLVGVDRASVELIHLTLPPAKPNELAELVAMQVFAQSQTAEEDAIVDFLPLGPATEAADRAPTEPVPVMAAVLPRQQMEAVQAACAAAGLKPSRVLLRPLAAASLLARRLSPQQGACLLVCPVGSEADLAILLDGRVVFQRTVRLPEDVGEETVAQRLAAEIHRTLVVAQQGLLNGNTVDQVFVFGSAEEHSLLVEAIRGELNIGASVIDPFEIANGPDDGPPERPARFAGLLGMVLDEADKTHAVDFLNPRRPPPRADRRRIAAVLVAAAMLAVAGVGYHAWSDIAAADEEIQRLTADIKERDKLLESTADARAVVEAVRAWESGGVVWLDELRDLSLRLPSGRDLILQRMTMALDRSGGGGIELTGTARDPQVVVRMEQSLRDAHHEVRSKRVQEREGKGYAWTFESSISVVGRDKASYLEPQAAAP